MQPNKTNNLEAYLIDLREGIKTKKANVSKNPQDFRAEIESITTGYELKPLENPAGSNYIQQDKEAYDDKGNKIVGSIPYKGNPTQTIDGINNTNISLQAGIYDGGVISLTNDIQNEVDIQESLINEIISILGNKGVE